MKPFTEEFVVVTATTDPDRALPYLRSWREQAVYAWRLIVVVNGRKVDVVPEGFGATWVGPSAEHLGTVPAFGRGLGVALEGPAPIIACLHDDVLIDEDGWDERVLSLFRNTARIGLVGFGGAVSLGAADIYQTPYDPMQLARGGFRSNLREAEAHGSRVVTNQPVAVLDGFSQIGRRRFWASPGNGRNLFSVMADLGVIHHAYDAALGGFARREGWETWLVPIACHHAGGLTAVGDRGYHAWAASQADGGDQAFWQQAHRWVYDEFRDVLPFSVEAS